MKLSRRELTRLLGLAGAATLLPRTARAGAPVPKRILFFYAGGSFRQLIANGSQPATLKSWWAPTAPNAPDFHAITAPWSTTQHTLQAAHQPLAAFKNKMLFLDGLDMRSAEADPMAADNAHIGGATHALVAANRSTGSLAGGVSIDQFIANGLNLPVPVTALPSLNLAVSSDSYPYENESQQTTGAPYYASSGQPIPLATNPKHAYELLLPNGPTAGLDAATQMRLAQQLKQQQSVLDFAAKRFDLVKASQRTIDRTRLDAHASMIRDLENRIALGSNISCTEPDEASIIAQVQGQSGTNSFHAHAQVMFQLTQVALACDLTRVVSIDIDGYSIPDADYGYVAGMNGTTDIHDLGHKTNGINAPLAGDSGAEAVMNNYQIAESALLAKLLTLLDAVPEADGTTLLDNTIVVWCQQIAAHDHSLDYIPYVLIGGANAGLSQGRYVRYPRTPNTNAWPMYSNGLAHNDLFVKLANLMGVTAGTFGNASVCKGPLDGLTS